jgi:hypothetical protein
LLGGEAGERGPRAFAGTYSARGSFEVTAVGSAAARRRAAFLAALSSRRSWSARLRWSLAIVVFRLLVDAMRLPWVVDVSEAA